ncbi:MAG: prepilin-type N-terminal cleavage/methylation domain-containing protein [Candidatus Omnitrophica bacterium]|nr:prepilin-type N-terminal cleavage/methylation domain-containing protein [Candidatus Omnitrophota bacterium]
MKRMKKSGFTLLELLVVVIIIGILVTVVVPQFGKVIDRSRETEALNILGSVLTSEYAWYQDPNGGNSTFTTNESNLTFALPTMKYWDRDSITIDTSVTPNTVTVVLKDNGTHGHATAGSHKVTGVINTDGTRTISFTRP